MLGQWGQGSTACPTSSLGGQGCQFMGGEVKCQVVIGLSSGKAGDIRAKIATSYPHSLNAQVSMAEGVQGQQDMEFEAVTVASLTPQLLPSLTPVFLTSKSRLCIATLAQGVYVFSPFTLSHKHCAS
jgi:hypothetical protein